MVEPLALEDVGAAAGLLARAFRDNPSMVAVFQGDPPEVREKMLVHCMASFAETVRRYGVAEVVKENGQVIAASLAFPPTRFPAPLWGQIIGAKGPIATGIRRALRLARMDHEMRKRHPRFAHWYLWILGVEPERQGQGFGGVLLCSMSAKADEDELPCYLETDKLTSVRLYEKHGYQVTSEETIASLDMHLWFMSRLADPGRAPIGTPNE